MFMDIVCAEFLTRHKPASTEAKPACMNMTRNPATNVQTMLMEYRLWAMRSYNPLTGIFDGSSSPGEAAGVAHVPAALPVGSGHLASFSSIFPSPFLSVG